MMMRVKNVLANQTYYTNVSTSIDAVIEWRISPSEEHNIIL